MSADGFQNNGIVKITESIELTDIACPWLDTKLEGSRKHPCFLKDKHRAEIWSEVNFLGVALWLEVSEAENLGKERFMPY